MTQRASLAAELWLFIKQNKKWWLIPMLVIIVVLAGLVIFSASPVAPFIYTLF